MRQIKKSTRHFINTPKKRGELEINTNSVRDGNLLSTGSTILNIACSNNASGGLLGGKYYLFVGSSISGKTWLAMTIFAESLLNKKFENHKLIYDNGEDGALMDIGFYFGKKTEKKIEKPCPNRKTKDNIPQPYSKTIEQFYDTIDDKLNEAEENKSGIIYILDSMDSLTTESEVKKANENKEKRKRNKETSGSYGDGKAKVNSQNLRRVVSRLKESNSILIIICQERDNLGSLLSTKTFSGGNSLTFYATLQIWFKKYKDIKTTINKKEHIIGNISKISIKKNRLTGQQHRQILLPIYHNFGIDDIGSSIDWLLENNFWEGGKSNLSKIKAIDFGIELNKENLVRHIEEKGLQKQLNILVQRKWNIIQTTIKEKIKRRNKYV